MVTALFCKIRESADSCLCAEDQLAKIFRQMEGRLFADSGTPGQVMLLFGQVATLVAVATDLCADLDFKRRIEVANEAEGHFIGQHPAGSGELHLGLHTGLKIGHDDTQAVIHIAIALADEVVARGLISKFR